MHWVRTNISSIYYFTEIPIILKQHIHGRTKWNQYTAQQLCCTPLEKSYCKNFPNLFFIVLDIEWLPKKIVNMICIYLVTCLAKKSEIDYIVFEQWSWNQYNFGHPKSQLFVTVQFDFVMGKSTISQRWQVIGMKATGATVSHIAQTMQMSQRTVYSMRDDTEKTPVMWRTDHVQGEGAQPLVIKTGRWCD